MSADNFYVVKGNKVWMGFASDIDAALNDAEVEWYRNLLKDEPIYEGDDADQWAHNEHSEYGVWSLPAEIKDE